MIYEMRCGILLLGKLSKFLSSPASIAHPSVPRPLSSPQTEISNTAGRQYYSAYSVLYVCTSLLKLWRYKRYGTSRYKVIRISTIIHTVQAAVVAISLRKALQHFHRHECL